MGFDFLHQAVTLSDLLRLLVVIALECALSADNALAIAVLIKKLPEAKRTKALWIGLWSSMFLRFGAIVLASHFYSLFLGSDSRRPLSYLLSHYAFCQNKQSFTILLSEKSFFLENCNSY